VTTGHVFNLPSNLLSTSHVPTLHYEIGAFVLCREFSRSDGERTPDAFDLADRDRPPIASIETVFRVPKQKQLIPLQRPASGPGRQRPSGGIVCEAMKRPAAGKEHMLAFGADAIACLGRHAFDEAIARAVKAPRRGIVGRNLAGPDGHDGAASDGAVASNIDPDRQRGAVIVEDEVARMQTETDRECQRGGCDKRGRISCISRTGHDRLSLPALAGACSNDPRQVVGSLLRSRDDRAAARGCGCARAQVRIAPSLAAWSA